MYFVKAKHQGKKWRLNLESKPRIENKTFNKIKVAACFASKMVDTEPGFNLFIFFPLSGINLNIQSF